MKQLVFDLGNALAIDWQEPEEREVVEIVKKKDYQTFAFDVEGKRWVASYALAADWEDMIRWVKIQLPNYVSHCGRTFDDREDYYPHKPEGIPE